MTQLQISASEGLIFSTWLKSHIRTCEKIKEGTDVSFLKLSVVSSRESGIGNSTVITCECGCSTDATDYSNW